MYSLHGEGISHPSLMTRREEPSIKDEWMEKINDIRVPRSAMNKLIMNYLVTEGFKDAAEKFQEEAGMSPGQNLSLLDNRIRIRDSIQVSFDYYQYFERYLLNLHQIKLKAERVSPGATIFLSYIMHNSSSNKT